MSIVESHVLVDYICILAVGEDFLQVKYANIGNHQDLNVERYGQAVHRTFAKPCVFFIRPEYAVLVIKVFIKNKYSSR